MKSPSSSPVDDRKVLEATWGPFTFCQFYMESGDTIVSVLYLKAFGRRHLLFALSVSLDCLVCERLYGLEPIMFDVHLSRNGRYLNVILPRLSISLPTLYAGQ